MRKSFLAGTLLLAIGIAGVIFSFGGSDGFSLNLATIDQSARFPAAGITKIKADIESADVRFEAAAGDEIEVRLEGRNAKRYADKIKLHADAEGDTLVIRTDMPRFQFGIVINEVTLRIALPEKTWEAIDLEAGSGDMTIGKLRAARLELVTGSGDMKLDAIEGESLRVKAGSGDIGLTAYRGDEVDVFVGSGEVRLADVEAAAQVETGSGDIDIEADALTHDTSIRTGSGDVTVELGAEPESLAFDFGTSAGDTEIEFGGFVLDGGGEGMIDLPGDNATGRFGGGGVRLQVRTGSGDIELARR